MSKCVAVIVSGGRGARFGGDVPKQYLEVGGKPLLAYCLQAFEECGCIDEIRLVAHKDWAKHCQQLAVQYNISKLTHVRQGGETRQQSVFAGICDIDDDAIVLIHDGVRPFVTAGQITQAANAAKANKAAIIAARVTDTIKQTCGGQTKTLPRDNLAAAQTPQGFIAKIIKQAHDKAVADGFDGPDDACLVERMGLPIEIIYNEGVNIKVTTKADIDYINFLHTQGGLS